MRRTIVFAAVLLVAAAASAQTPAVPRTHDGKPDMSGIWQTFVTAEWNIEDHAASLGVPAGQGIVDGDGIPYQPWARAKQQDNVAKRQTTDPSARCILPGVPRIFYQPFPFQIVQSSAHIAVLFEYGHATRNIFMNTPHLPGPLEWFMGDSRGRWDGDTLVVDVTYFTDRTWFDKAGNFHSEALHLVERYSMLGPDHIQYVVTIEDPKVFTRPWTMRMPFYRRKEPNVRLLEYECSMYLLEDATRRGVIPTPALAP
jgi:hypothetical protein